jgi:hypothetical protein
MLGYLSKMQTELTSPVNYRLNLGNDTAHLNAYLGKPVKLTHTGKIVCVYCQQTTKKSFNQGYCYPCFIRLAQCDLCIMKPETCHYAAGTCREPAWGESYCMQPHYVYLANSSGIKVGITRQHQIPTRWIDQGAVQALPVFKTKTRHIAGLLEVTLGKYISDKTHWQQMLKNKVDMLDLACQREELIKLCLDELTVLQNRLETDAFHYLSDEKVIDIQYPVLRYPEKVKSFNLDKQPEVTGVLEGVKGQYLLLDTGVINIRKFTGYEIRFGT